MRSRLGFGSGLVGMVRVGVGKYYVQESPHKDRNMRVSVRKKQDGSAGTFPELDTDYVTERFKVTQSQDETSGC